MINIILLGGTISKDKFSNYNNNYISDLISNSRLLIQYKIHDLFAIDSMDFDEELTTKLIEYINLIKSTKILILIGTDKMILVAQQIKKNITNKIIIFTGSIIPYVDTTNTDSTFNFGCALGILVNCLVESNVYVCMNGRLLDPCKTIKDKKRKIFILK